MPLSVGQHIHNNRYRIVKLIGQGGFGAVYRAWDTSLNLAVAVKENLDTSPEARKQFGYEAHILARLSHPHLPRVIDYFFIPGQGQYLVMDFVEGEDLQAMLDRLGPLPEVQVLPWIEQVCDALAYLHSQNPPIIHRDLKPANIKIRSDGRAMLVDFGIAKVYDPNLSTTVGARAVTPGFSPPEQYGQGKTDARSDIYALGATLYTLLTGQTPPESVQLVTSSATLTPPRQVNPQVSQVLEQAILRSLEIDTRRRFQSVAELQASLVSSPPASLLPASSPPFSPPLRPLASSRHLWPAAVSGVGVIAAIVAIAWSLAGGSGRAPATETPTVAVQGGVAAEVTSTSTPASSRPSSSPYPITLTANVTEGVAPLEVNFTSVLDGRSSDVRDYICQEAQFDFGDGNSLSITMATCDPDKGQRSDAASYVYEKAGEYRVTYALGALKSEPVTIVVREAGGSSHADTPEASATPAEAATPDPTNVSQTAVPPMETPTIPPTETPILPMVMPAPTPANTLVPPPPASGRIAFVSDRVGNYEIYIMNADGSGQTNLTNTPGSDESQPTWSQDGKQIAFISNRGNNMDIYVMNADGSKQSRLTDNPTFDWMPRWSPNNQRITFVSERDGNYEIYAMNADGSRLINLTNNPASDSNPAWSPDGQHITFVSDRDGNYEIYVMNADGSEQICLTKNPARDGEIQLGENYYWGAPSDWTPIGQNIAFVSDRDGNGEIYVMNPDGRDQIRLTNHPANDLYATWSPDGRRIAFMSDRNGAWEIYIMNNDGNEQINLTNNLAQDFDPAWSPR